MTENTQPREIPLDRLADDTDELDWDVNVHGRFKEHVAEPPKTELFYEGDV